MPIITFILYKFIKYLSSREKSLEVFLLNTILQMSLQCNNILLFV